MSNLAIVDVLLLCTRPGRSLLNKLPIYTSRAIELTAYYKLICIATLVSYLNHHKKHMIHRAQISINQHYYGLRNNAEQHTPHHSTLPLHSMAIHHRTSTQCIRHRLYIAHRNSIMWGGGGVQENESLLNIACRNNKPSTQN
jgi:hypothetical protein